MQYLKETVYLYELICFYSLFLLWIGKKIHHLWERVKISICKYLNHFEKCKIFLSILAIINWIVWTCAKDFNSSFWLSSTNYICLVANLLLDFISKVISLDFNLCLSTLTNPSTNLFTAFIILDNFDQWSFMKCYFVGHLWQLVKNIFWDKRRIIHIFPWCLTKVSRNGTSFSSSPFDDAIVNT